MIAGDFDITAAAETNEDDEKRNCIEAMLKEDFPWVITIFSGVSLTLLGLGGICFQIVYDYDLKSFFNMSFSLVAYMYIILVGFVTMLLICKRSPETYTLAHYMHIGCIFVCTILVGVSYLSSVLILHSRSYTSFLIIGVAIVVLAISLSFALVVKKKWRKKLSLLRETRRINDANNNHPMNYTHYQPPEQIANFNFIYDVQPQGVSYMDPPPLYQSIYPIFPGTDQKQN